MGFRFARWLLMMFIFTFSSSHSHRDCDCWWLVWWYWMSENEWKLFVEGWKWIWQSFLSFLQWWKQSRNEISFVLFSIFADFADCYQFSQNETNRHSFWIVIWESVILIKLVEMIEISIAFAKNVLILFCFVSSFWFEDCWKRAMWKEIWNLLVRNNWWNSRKKEGKKSVIFRICQTGWNSLAIGLAEWLKLVAIKQTTISTTTELILLISSFSEWEKCGFL